MAADIVVAIDHPDDIVEARKAGHQLALDLGFSLTDVTMIATAISEIARNITSYAGRGAVRVAIADREGRKALVVRAEDQGPGDVDGHDAPRNQAAAACTHRPVHEEAGGSAESSPQSDEESGHALLVRIHGDRSTRKREPQQGDGQPGRQRHCHQSPEQ